jgi:hypothetical protein
MTRAQGRTYGVVTPSPSQLWLGTMLCGLAERVLHAVRVFRRLMSRLSGECHADVAPHRLPGGNSGIAEKEQQQHVDTDAAARAAVIVAAGVAARATRAASVLPAGPLIQKSNLPAEPAGPAAAATADRYWGLSSRKREALSGTHSSTFGLAGPWVPALRGKAPSAGMTAMGCLRPSLHSAPA